MIRMLLDIIKIGVQQYGALFAVVGFVCFILWYVLKHIMKESVKRELEQRKIINAQIKESRLQRKQRHQDHTKISNSLDEVVKAIGRINGYKK